MSQEVAKWLVTGLWAVLIYSVVLVSRRVSAWLKQKRLISQGIKCKRDHLEQRSTVPSERLLMTDERLKFVADLTTSELIQHLQEGKVKATEAMIVAIRLSQNAHRLYNCLSDAMFSEALDQAHELDLSFEQTGLPVGPLHGLPVSIKDNIRVQGSDSTLGTIKRSVKPSKTDAGTVKLLKNAGAIPFCKTNVPQTLMLPITENPVIGRTLNCWNLKRSPGGSSGGEGVLVGCGASRLGLGTDIGGSLRIPAHNCGICAFKPTSGRITRTGMKSALKQHFVPSVPGPMTRDVDEMEIALRVLLDGPSCRSFDPSVPMQTWRSEVYNSSTPLKIGYFLHDGWYEISKSCERATLESLQILRKAGHTVEEFQIPIDLVDGIKSYVEIMCSDKCEQIRTFIKGEPLNPNISKLIAFCSLVPAPFQRAFANLLRISGDVRLSHKMASFLGLSIDQEWNMQKKLRKMKSKFQVSMKEQGMDAIIVPFPALALKHELGAEMLQAFSYSLMFNYLDLPVGTVPVSLSKKEDVPVYKKRPADRLDRFSRLNEADGHGLPIGVQVVSLPFEEEVALRVMRDLQTFNPEFTAPKDLRDSIVNGALGLSSSS